MFRNLSKLFLIATAVAFSAGLARAQSDLPEMAQWMQDSAHQATLAPGTKITMANWQRYKQFLPVSMIALFQGTYQLKMPPDVEIDIGQTEGRRPSNTARRPGWFICPTARQSASRICRAAQMHRKVSPRFWLSDRRNSAAAEEGGS
jgi:hypothetical protein